MFPVNIYSSYWCPMIKFCGFMYSGDRSQVLAYVGSQMTGMSPPLAAGTWAQMAGRGAVGGVGLSQGSSTRCHLAFSQNLVVLWQCDVLHCPWLLEQESQDIEAKTEGFLQCSLGRYTELFLATSLCQHEPDSKRRDYSKAQIRGVMGNCEGIFEA